MSNQKQLNIRISSTTAEDTYELRFVEQRICGGLYLDTLIPTQDHRDELIPNTIPHIRPDPLDNHFNRKYICRNLRARYPNLRRALLDQSLSSGIGNIYADEALFRAKLHFGRPTETLTRKEVTRVYQAAEEVMRLALAQGGTSFDALYVNVNGESGYFARSLNVYGRQGQPCLRCQKSGIEIQITRTKFMNRSAYFCPRCQPVPRRARW